MITGMTPSRLSLGSFCSVGSCTDLGAEIIIVVCETIGETVTLVK